MKKIVAAVLLVLAQNVFAIDTQIKAGIEDHWIASMYDDDNTWVINDLAWTPYIELAVNQDWVIINGFKVFGGGDVTTWMKNKFIGDDTDGSYSFQPILVNYGLNLGIEINAGQNNWLTVKYEHNCSHAVFTQAQRSNKKEPYAFDQGSNKLEVVWGNKW